MDATFSIELQRSGCARMQLPYRRWHCVSFHPVAAPRVARAGAWGQERDAMTAGEVGVYPAGESEIIDWEGPVEIMHLHIDPSLIAQARKDAGMGHESGVARAFRSDDYILAGLAADLFETVRSADHAGVEDCVQAIVGRLAAAHEAPRPQTRPRLGRVFLDDVLDRMHGAAAAQVGVTDLAAFAGLSSGRFTRAFSAAFGSAPHNYLLRNRIEVSKAQLAAGSPLAEVSLACGFYDQSHFTHAFRRRTGMTPSAFAAWAAG